MSFAPSSALAVAFVAAALAFASKPALKHQWLPAKLGRGIEATGWMPMPTAEMRDILLVQAWPTLANIVAVLGPWAILISSFPPG
jgi:hypothetical protein